MENTKGVNAEMSLLYVHVCKVSLKECEKLTFEKSSLSLDLVEMPVSS